MSQPRIWISNATPDQGELVRVRALIEHRMETGLRAGADGKPVARNIVSEFQARLNDDLLFEWQPETAISQNPYIEFTFVATKSGRLNMTWTDDSGAVVTGSTTVTVKG
ncbi:MAG TPA: thiosulfate oxidation carrier complex protein SoxZ [Pusillimonas sp.]|uniref:thiosulfate oxidation carrier complex protein SoxZ n=1 Tax=Pusillimonas sp. TaxID=3040095 RepID=UPI002C8DD39C|nr:thiosulfate oxidation carrier complex protein SoxZ [Pusillimonas sp.]HUH86660.1 thiosulfate oxidation carrier complex protein SoxZ [Pusillimonas sp.]